MKVRDLIQNAANGHGNSGCVDLAVAVLGRGESGGATNNPAGVSEGAAHVLDSSGEAARARADAAHACSLDDDVQVVRDLLTRAGEVFVLDENRSVVAVLSSAGGCQAGPERLSDTHSKKEADRHVDEAGEESFPASDPPGY